MYYGQRELRGTIKSFLVSQRSNRLGVDASSLDAAITRCLPSSVDSSVSPENLATQIAAQLHAKGILNSRLELSETRKLAEGINRGRKGLPYRS